jgi:hypothetical protein
MSTQPGGSGFTALGGRVLDVTAIHDITIGRTIYAAAFLAAANDIGIALAIPAAALQEAWAIAEIEDHPFFDLLLGLPLVVVDALDAEAARRAGILGRDTYAAGQWDAAAAHTVLVSQDRRWAALTADAAPLRRIDDHVDIEVLPDQ